MTAAPARLLNESDTRLLGAALQAMANAYAPYSHFHVGAAVRTRSGAIHVGCNLENASYGLSLCAEAGALCRAAASGDYQVLQIAVVGSLRGAPSSRLLTPCGRCRQLILEAAQNARTDIEVLCASVDGSQVERYPISALLPAAFDAAWLESPPTR